MKDSAFPRRGDMYQMNLWEHEPTRYFFPARLPTNTIFAKMYGDLGNKLVRFTISLQSWILISQVQNAKRILALPHLPPYQTETVRAVTREVRDLDKDVANILQPFSGSFNPSAEPATACSLLVNHLCMRRNKRCLLAYHRTRTDKLEEMVWSGSDVLDQAIMAQHNPSQGQSAADLGNGEGNTSSLSPEEEEYVRQYGDLLAAYKGQWTDVDLTGSLEPPKDLFIDVRVLKDAGEIQTEYGWVSVITLDLVSNMMLIAAVQLHWARIRNSMYGRAMWRGSSLRDIFKNSADYCRCYEYWRLHSSESSSPQAPINSWE